MDPELLPAGACGPICSYVVRDANGREVAKNRYASDSFLLQFFRYLYCNMGVTQTLSIQTIHGNTQRAVDCQDWLETEYAANTSVGGIIVGTNTGAVVFADSAVRARINHGSASGQLQYGASVLGQPASNAAGTSIILTRDFSNASGAEIVVGETSIVTGVNGSATPGQCLALVRDTANISVPDGGTLTFNYELRTTL